MQVYWLWIINMEIKVLILITSEVLQHQHHKQNCVACCVHHFCSPSHLLSQVRAHSTILLNIPRCVLRTLQSTQFQNKSWFTAVLSLNDFVDCTTTWHCIVSFVKPTFVHFLHQSSRKQWVQSDRKWCKSQGKECKLVIASAPQV